MIWTMILKVMRLQQMTVKACLKESVQLHNQLIPALKIYFPVGPDCIATTSLLCWKVYPPGAPVVENYPIIRVVVTMQIVMIFLWLTKRDYKTQYVSALCW